MAIHAPITGAQSRAPSNVIRLPTAASRKVQQPTARRCRIAVEAGAAVTHPAKWRTPRQRQLAIAGSGLSRTPELLLVMALLRSLPIEQMRVVFREVSAVAMKDDGEAATSAATLAAAFLLMKTESPNASSASRDV